MQTVEPSDNPTQLAISPAPLAELIAPSSPVPQWLTVDRCPSCGSTRVRERHALSNTFYFFGNERIHFPDRGIAVLVCTDCRLVYKNVLPTPDFLAQVFRRQTGMKWMESNDFSLEVAELKRVAGSGLRDVLDIGAGNGDFLKSCAIGGIRGRLSALDVVVHPGLMRYLTGEFIQGFADVTRLHWSGKPYQVVTLFDVLEHLYSPLLAFKNLQRLVKRGGWVLLETGNVDSEWPRRYGLSKWWYVDLFEHHVFWSRRSLEHIARRCGFDIVYLQERRHKSRLSPLSLHTAKDLIKVFFYCTARGAYASLAAHLGKRGAQPWDPFTRDHIRAVLRRR
ncbi:MAG: class I SAM-dependent methyltransferase [Gammaproteobacteria bacterium]|nr:class I SAM-dependent methyltransferase [Gammaproteobacteria bacterium]